MKRLNKVKIILKKITICKDYFLVIEKAVFGILTHSSIMWINSLYSCFLGTARSLCIKNLNSDYKKQYKTYISVAILLILASIVYGIYNSIVLFAGKKVTYHLYISIGIAAFTFFEFGFNIRELIKVRKINSPIAKSIAYINFSAICASFVLTQTVLTSLHPEENYSFQNGLSAAIFAGIIFLTGLYMLISKNKLKEYKLIESSNL